MTMKKESKVLNMFKKLHNQKMDTNQSSQIPEKKFNGLLFLEVGLAEVFSVIFALLLIFGTLNYFGFLPISESVPFLSFLPKQHRAQNLSTKIASPTNTTLPANLKKTFPFASCPVEQKFCAANGGIIILFLEKDKVSSFSAIGYSKLPPGTKILSAISGDVQVKNQASSDGTLVSIINVQRNIQANYEFSKDSLKTSTFSARVSSEGETIGVITDGNKTIDKFGDKFNLIFSIQSLNTKAYIKIKPSPDGKSILNI